LYRITGRLICGCRALSIAGAMTWNLLSYNVRDPIYFFSVSGVI